MNARETFMDINIPTLLPGEKEALLEALRRDLRSQRCLAMHDTGRAIWHQRNVQLNVRLLEAFNPKRIELTKPVREDCLTSCSVSNRRQIGTPTSEKLLCVGLNSKDLCSPA